MNAKKGKGGEKMAVNLGKELCVVLYMRHIRKNWNDISESALLRAIQAAELDLELYHAGQYREKGTPDVNYLAALRFLLAELRVENQPKIQPAML